MKIVGVALLLTFLVMACLFVSCSNSSNSYRSPMTDGLDSNTNESGNAIEFGEKIIKDATVVAETKDFINATDSLKSLIKAYNGGIVSSSSSEHASYHDDDEMIRKSNYTIKIPSEKFDEFLDKLNEYFNITNITTNTEDVTDEYYDLNAIIDTLKSKQEGLRTMLSETDKNMNFGTWKQINDELTDVETQLARCQAQLKLLEGKTAYSTINLSITEVKVLTDTQEITFLNEIKNAFDESINFSIDITKGLLILVIYLLPAIVFCAIVSGVVLIVVFCVTRKRKK